MTEPIAAVTSLADSFASRGVWVAIAVLVVAVAYLFRELRKLEREFRESILASRDKHAALLASCEQALQQNSASIRDFRTALESLHEAIRMSYQRGSPPQPPLPPRRGPMP